MNRAANSNLRGSIVPLVTPFTDRSEIDFQALRTLVEEQVDSSSHGISVTGTTGEPGSLSVSERLQMVEAGAEYVAGRLPYVPGTGTMRLGETIEITKRAAEVGADAALIITPYYARPTQEGLFRWFAAIAEAVDIPIVAYNIPRRAAVEISPGTMARIYNEIPNVIGMKESSPDFAHANLVMTECGPEFLLFSGLELLCFPLLALGAAGFISVTANVVPNEIARLYEAFQEGNYDEARELHYRLMELNDVVLAETNPTAVKWLLSQMGRIGPTLRPPLVPLSDAGQQRVTAAAAAWNLLEPVA